MYQKNKTTAKEIGKIAINSIIAIFIAEVANAQNK